MDDETRLTLEQARARFGELMHQPTRTYMDFERPEGVWRAHMVRGASGRLELDSYRLHLPVRRAKTRVAYKPKPKA